VKAGAAAFRRIMDPFIGPTFSVLAGAERGGAPARPRSDDALCTLPAEPTENAADACNGAGPAVPIDTHTQSHTRSVIFTSESLHVC
jgi:hypothetical protein